MAVHILYISSGGSCRQWSSDSQWPSSDCLQQHSFLTSVGRTDYPVASTPVHGIHILHSHPNHDLVVHSATVKFGSRFSWRQTFRGYKRRRREMGDMDAMNWGGSYWIIDSSHWCQEWMLLQTVSWRSFAVTAPLPARPSAAHVKDMDCHVLLSVDRAKLKNVTIHITSSFQRSQMMRMNSVTKCILQCPNGLVNLVYWIPGSQFVQFVSNLLFRYFWWFSGCSKPR